MNYGLSYMGSKNKIVPFIIENLPEADYLYDLFGGGGAVTHGAILSGKYKQVILNDIQPGLTKLFKDAVDGKYKDEKRWITKEDFFNPENKNDKYIQVCWSFGNQQNGYLYSDEYAGWKRAYHYAVVLNDYSIFADMGIIVESKETDIHKRKLDIRHQLMANKEENKHKYEVWYLKGLGLTEEEIEPLTHQTKEKTEVEKARLQKLLRDALKKSGLKQSDINKLTNSNMAGHWFGNSQWAFPTKDMYKILQTKLELPDYFQTVKYYEILSKRLESLERLQSLQNLQNLQSLERLERLERLQSLESLERLERLQSLQNLQSLESLERLQSLESLESLQSLEIYELNYYDVKIKPNSIIYCDIPYKNTTGYVSGEFDYDTFYDWCEKQTVPVYISEYDMPADRFKCIAQKDQTRKLSQTAATKCTEKIFVPIIQIKKGIITAAT